jgi:2-haloacid dehalogenase
MRGLAELAVHEDVPDGMRALRASGRRLVTLTNGSTQGSERLLTDTGVRDRFQALLSVEDAGAWKPVRTAYEYAARAYGTDPADMLLVAVHPWDIDGAARAVLTTVWIDRTGTPYPQVLHPTVAARHRPHRPSPASWRGRQMLTCISTSFPSKDRCPAAGSASNSGSR